MGWTTAIGDAVPPWILQWLNFGAAYPKGDQDQLFALGDALKHAAAELEKLEPSLKSATNRVPQYYEGDGSTAIATEFAKLFDAGDVHSIPKLIEGLGDLGRDARSTATEIEFAKIQAEIFAVLTMWTVYSLLSSIYGWAAVTPVLAGARITLGKFAAEVAERIGANMLKSGLKELAAPLSREIIVPAGERLALIGDRLAPTLEKLGTPLNKWQALNQTIAKAPAVVRYPVAALKGGAMGAGLDAGSQVVQIMEGHRDGGFDLKQTFQTGLQWGAGGALGGVGHDLSNKGLSIFGKDVPKSLGGRLTGGVVGGLAGAGGMYGAGLGTQLYDNDGNWNKVNKSFSPQLLIGGLAMGGMGGGAHGLHERSAEIATNLDAGPTQSTMETAAVDKGGPQASPMHSQPTENGVTNAPEQRGNPSNEAAKTSDIGAKSTDTGAKVSDGGAKVADSGAKPADPNAKSADSGARPAGSQDRLSEANGPKDARPSADNSARTANAPSSDQKASFAAGTQDKAAPAPTGRTPEIRSVTPPTELRPVTAEPANAASPAHVTQTRTDAPASDVAPTRSDQKPESGTPNRAASPESPARTEPPADRDRARLEGHTTKPDPNAHSAEEVPKEHPETNTDRPATEPTAADQFVGPMPYVEPPAETPRAMSAERPRATPSRIVDEGPHRNDQARAAADAVDDFRGDARTHERPEEPYLTEPHVAEALARGDEQELTTQVNGVETPVSDVIRDRLPQHPELVEAIRNNPFLERSLLERPKALASLLIHPEGLPILHEALAALHERGPEICLADPVHIEETPLTSEQHVTSEATQNAVRDKGIADRTQPGFDQSRRKDTEYQREFLRQQYDVWEETQTALNEVVTDIAGETGEPGWRTEPKDEARAWDKIREYNGDVSRLTDLVGAKIVYSDVAEAYKALDKIVNDPRIEVNAVNLACLS
ncbi:hypothetical protein [Nocardia seriolae]|nr:hypothetical protein [Nocardia seriolae]MTJ60983.1 hypothetical protein [Nocardia seriolae]MTJ76522.1 hypothetical protein [Nocardia seriolae]MTJ90883.1 hypothetical protein [Nocardia seriolae]MTK34840.1 hypothetical protein [Nocardia seriolae]MTK38962.1 hypothetical protein [Nocardia seriolae]